MQGNARVSIYWCGENMSVSSDSGADYILVCREFPHVYFCVQAGECYIPPCSLYSVIFLQREISVGGHGSTPGMVNANYYILQE